MAAIKFHILKYDALKDFVFNPKESLSFEGETGPYIQYTHARSSSVLRKAKLNPKIDFSLLNTGEDKAIIKLLHSFPMVVKKAAAEYKPNHICRHLLDLSQAFNEYYHKHIYWAKASRALERRVDLLHPERAVSVIWEGRAGCDRECQGKGRTCLGRVQNAIVPQASSGVVRIALPTVLFQHRALELSLNRDHLLRIWIN